MDLLSHFWAPLCAIGGHGDRRRTRNSPFGVRASIVPDRPRLMVILTKANYTHDLVRASGTMTITVLEPTRWDSSNRWECGADVTATS